MGRSPRFAPFAAALTLVLASIAYGRFDPSTDASLLGWWPLDEGMGTVAADASGHGNDGTINGGASWVTGLYGAALQFNGQDAFVDTGESLLNDLTGFTMAGWVSADNPGAYASLFGQNDLIEFGFTTESGGQIGTWMLGNDWAFVGADYDFPYPSWHHLVLTGDATRIAIYVDGEKQASDEGGMVSGASSFLFRIGGNVFNTTGDWFEGEIDDVWLFGRRLTEGEIRILMKGPGGPGLATAPQPADEAVDVPRDATLSWTAGEFAATHDVYFGASFDDVNDADRGSPAGALASQAQTTTTYDPGILEFGQTYTWRIDEVNTPPGSTILRGNVWSFTTEPFAYPIQDIIATTNGTSEEGSGPENTVNGSGLSADDRHSIDAADMWQAMQAGEDPLWIQYEFDRLYKVHQLQVWNYNVQFEKILGFGIKDVTIETSADGLDWTALSDFEFAQATAKATYTSNTTIDLGGVAARFIRLVVNSGFGGTGQYGLSEVRFTYIPVQPREPQPVNGATQVSPDVALAWRAGREAATHEVYLATDHTALPLVATTETSAFTPAQLTFGKTYYWQIVEVNESETIGSWAGDIWSFSTQEYALIDGFESYTDNLEAGEAIFDTWVDGWVNGTGSTVGYFESPFAERTIVHSGNQSMPLQYDNTTSPWYSETTRTWQTPQDWTAYGADTLVLYVQGRAPAFLETADGQIIMNAIGSDIWDAADEFRFAYKSLSGNGSILARVDRLLDSNAWAKAGVMIRETLEPGSKHAMVVVTPSNGISFQRRPETDAASENTDAPGFAAPHWVKLTRSGNVFTAQRSADGITWIDIPPTSPVEIPMAANVHIGLALTSHDTGVSTAAEFSGVAASGGVSGPWQTAEIGVAQPEGNPGDPLYVAVQDAPGKSAVVRHPDAIATARPGWRQWRIPVSEFASAGLTLDRVEVLSIGVGDPEDRVGGGIGLIYVDDIGFGRPAETR